MAQNLSDMWLSTLENEGGVGGAPSLRHRNGAEITVLVCEQKPYPGGIPHLFERLFFA